MSISTPARSARRAIVGSVALAATIVAAAVAPAGAAAAGSSVRVPQAVAGASILVTYRDGAAFRAGTGSAVASESDRVDALNVKVFKPKRGQEQRAMRELAGSRGVVAVESDARVETTLTPNDPHWAGRQRWAHDKVALRTAWDMGKGSSSVVIAILDSGLETSHPEFANRIVEGYDFVENDRTPNDPRGHGTMSGGAAAARGNNSAGVAGGCWACRILPVRVLNENGTGYASWVVKGITYAADRGASVISMSFGGFAESASMASAIAYARSKGAVVVASAGNDGNTRPFFPAAYPGVVAVAASDPSDRPYSWSNRGAWVELAAPGCFWTTRTGRSYGNFCGTSASAPLVSGIVGLMRSANPAASGAAIEKALLSTATALSWVNHGRPNATAAVKAARAIRTVAPVAETPLKGKTTDALILRKGPATTQAALRTLPLGTTLSVTGPLVADAAGRTWAPVATASGAKGFVAAWYVSFSGSAVPTDNVILRAKPSTGAIAIVTVKAGTRVTVTASTADASSRVWLKVRTAAGQTGYMAGWFMRP